MRSHALTVGPHTALRAWILAFSKSRARTCMTCPDSSSPAAGCWGSVWRAGTCILQSCILRCQEGRSRTCPSAQLLFGRAVASSSCSPPRAACLRRQTSQKQAWGCRRKIKFDRIRPPVRFIEGCEGCMCAQCGRDSPASRRTAPRPSPVNPCGEASDPPPSRSAVGCAAVPVTFVEQKLLPPAVKRSSAPKNPGRT